MRIGFNSISEIKIEGYLPFFVHPTHPTYPADYNQAKAISILKTFRSHRQNKVLKDVYKQQLY